MCLVRPFPKWKGKNPEKQFFGQKGYLNVRRTRHRYTQVGNNWGWFGVVVWFAFNESILIFQVPFVLLPLCHHLICYTNDSRRFFLRHALFEKPKGLGYIKCTRKICQRFYKATALT